MVVNAEHKELLTILSDLSDSHPRRNGYTLAHIAQRFSGNKQQVFSLLGDLNELSYVRSRKVKLSGSTRPATEYYEIGVKGKVALDQMTYKPVAKITTSAPRNISSKLYINPDLIDAFLRKSNKFNYKKLVSLLKELNDNYARSNVYACSQLLKGLVNHIPPLLGYRTFEQVVSNYSWGKSHQQYLDDILKYINEADSVTHTLVSDFEDQTSLDSLPKAVYINTLLSVCIAESGNNEPIKGTPQLSKQSQPIKPSIVKSKISFELENQQMKWANWGGYGSGFMGQITINNFEGSLNNFIVDARLSYVLADGISWNSQTYKFDNLKYKAKLKVSANDIYEGTIWISDGQRTDKGIMDEGIDGTGTLVLLLADNAKLSSVINLSNNN